MSQATQTESVAIATPPFSLIQVLPWLIFAGMLALVALYFISAEQGAASLFSGTAVHEWVHDGRHLLGFPPLSQAVTSARDFLIRGLFAGLFAGLVAFGVAYAIGEPSIDAAIAIEESAGSGHDHADEPTASDRSDATEVPRSLQSTAGLLTGTMVAGVTLGGLVGVLSALALGRFGRLSVRGISLSLAAIGFVSVSLLPFVAYPPNPPAVGDPRDYWHSHGALLHHACDLDHRGRHRHLGWAQSRYSMGSLVCHLERHRRLPAGDPHRSGAAAELLGGAG